eukprot:1158976-Pelagomonas_calceolata.AAC.2
MLNLQSLRQLCTQSPGAGGKSNDESSVHSHLPHERLVPMPQKISRIISLKQSQKHPFQNTPAQRRYLHGRAEAPRMRGRDDAVETRCTGEAWRHVLK